MKNTGIVAGVLVALATPAHAKDTTVAETVRYQMSELTSDGGVHALKLRVRKAAKRVCGWPGSGITIYMVNCYDMATMDGLKQVERAVNHRRGNAMASVASIGAASIVVRAR